MSMFFWEHIYLSLEFDKWKNSHETYSISISPFFMRRPVYLTIFHCPFLKFNIWGNMAWLYGCLAEVIYYIAFKLQFYAGTHSAQIKQSQNLSTVNKPNAVRIDGTKIFRRNKPLLEHLLGLSNMGDPHPPLLTSVSSTGLVLFRLISHTGK